MCRTRMILFDAHHGQQKMQSKCIYHRLVACAALDSFFLEPTSHHGSCKMAAKQFKICKEILGYAAEQVAAVKSAAAMSNNADSCCQVNVIEVTAEGRGTRVASYCLYAL